VTQPPPGDPGLPNEPFIEQPEKNGNKDPDTWKVVPLEKDPSRYKVVDNQDINIAVEFNTTAGAQQYIDHFKWLKNNPTTHVCPAGQHWDDAQQKCVDDTTVPPVGKDPFGVREIYPTGRTGEEWFMNMNDPNHDPRTEPQTTLFKNSDGTWKIKSDAVRFRAYTSKGYHPELITTTNQKELAAKGYMQSPNDWRDVEITGYVKLNKVGGSVTGASGNLVGGHYTWYSRNARNTGDGAPEGCLGTAYKGWVNFGGKPLQTRFAKEQWHVSYAYSPYVDTPFTTLFGKWIGFKTIIYSIQLNGKTAVKMESWLDGNNDGNWVKLNEFIDSGGFGKDGKECGGDPDQIITWGGPTAVYRWDNAPDVDVKWFSVREIKSPAALP